jgi:hypothetical protein
MRFFLRSSIGDRRLALDVGHNQAQLSQWVEWIFFAA